MRRLLSLLILLLSLQCTALYAASSSENVSPAGDTLTIRRELRLAIEAIKGSTTEVTKLKYQQSIEQNSNFAPAHYKLAEIFRKDSLAKALSAAQCAYELDTLNRWYLELYAELALRSMDLAKAEQLYKKIIRYEPRNGEAYQRLAIIYETTQRPQQAIDLLDSAATRLGVVTSLEAIKLRLLVGTNQGEQAIENIKQQISIIPEDIDLQLSLAQLYTYMRRDSLAEATLRRALEINPNSPMALIAIAEHFLSQGNYEEYITTLIPLFDSETITTEGKLQLLEQFTNDDQLYKRYFFKLNSLISVLILRHPNDGAVVECYARHLIRSGMLDKALELYKSHIYDHPLNAEYISSVIDIESYKQRPDSVDLYINRAIELFPEQPSFRLAKATSLAGAKDYAGAIASYTSSLESISDKKSRSEVWATIGDLHHQIKLESGTPIKLKDLKETFSAYDKALEYNPDNAMVLNNYAYFLSEARSEMNRAEQMSARAIELVKGNATLLDTYGWILFLKGDYTKAKEYLRQAVSLDEYDSPEIQLHYGDLLEAMGEYFMAEIYWKKAEKFGYPAEEINLRIEQLNDRKE